MISLLCFTLTFKPFEMRRHFDISLTMIMTLTLTVTMLWPMENSLPVLEGSDKLVHFLAFGALVFPLAYTGRFELTSILILASAYGAIIELIQPTFNRNADLSDWIADPLGVIFGIGLGLAYRRFTQPRV